MSSVIFNKIASEVGVSPRTVRRVLTSELKDTRPSIVRRTERIRQLADQLNYRPNAAARAVASGRFGAIGLLSSTDPVRSAINQALRGVQQGCREHNLHLTLGIVEDEELSREDALPRLLREWSADGILLNYTHGLPREVLDLLQRHDTPAIWLNCKLRRDCVYPADYEAAMEAVRYLAEQGRRRIAYFDRGYQTHYSVEDRRRGCVDGAARAGVDCAEWRFPSTMPVREVYQVVRERMSRADRPDAVVAYGHAALVIRAASEAGLEPPHDVEVVGFGEDAMDHAGLEPVVMMLPSEALGREAVRLLLEKIDQPGKELPPVTLPLRLRVPRDRGAAGPSGHLPGGQPGETVADPSAGVSPARGSRPSNAAGS